jgi:uncharacterized RDD family membrane protein YckC
MQSVWRLDAYTAAIGESSANGRILARQVAGIGARFLAGFVDFIVQCIMAALFALAVYWRHPQLIAPGDRLWFFTSALLEWHILYFVLFESFTAGRSPGKSLVGLTVVDARTGSRARPLQLVIRNVMRLVDILPVHYIAAAISMAAGPARQRIGDRLCSTCVIYVRSLVEQLHSAGVPDSNYSTSDDGYLLEAFVRRFSKLHENVRPFLAREVARYFQKKYPATEAGLMRLYDEEKYGDYLDRLYRQESALGSASANV